MNWKVLWQKIYSNPVFVTVWTAFAGALAEQFLRLANSGSFDWTRKGLEEMVSGAAVVALTALAHLYIQPPGQPQMLGTTPPGTDVHEIPATLQPASPQDVEAK